MIKPKHRQRKPLPEAAPLSSCCNQDSSSDHVSPEPGVLTKAEPWVWDAASGQGVIRGTTFAFSEPPFLLDPNRCFLRHVVIRSTQVNARESDRENAERQPGTTRQRCVLDLLSRPTRTGRAHPPCDVWAVPASGSAITNTE